MPTMGSLYAKKLYGKKRLFYRHQRFAFGEPIDDGHSFYKYKYLCFNCQKVFRPADRSYNIIEVCPNCHSTKVQGVGPMFKPPRTRDNHSWNQLRKRFDKSMAKKGLTLI